MRISYDHGETWTEVSEDEWFTAKLGEPSAERTCIECGETFPATSEHFEPGYGGSAEYLSRRCRPCESKRLWRGEESEQWFWKRQEERDQAHRTLSEYDADAWGGHESRYGSILDDWPEAVALENGHYDDDDL